MKISSVEAVFRALNDACIRYLVVGGLAVNAHGYERFTSDIDLVICLERENIVKGLQALLNIGYLPAVPITPEEFADPVNRERWRREKNMLVLKLWSDLHHRTPIDVFVYHPFDFETEYGRAKRMEIATDLAAPFVARDSLIAMKRESGRPQDFSDITALEELHQLSDNGGDVGT